MLPVLTASAMREADRRAMSETGVPGVVLMENAGAAVAEALRAAPPGRLLFVCGKGNNGGDGFAAARRLLARSPEVVLLGRCGDVRGDAGVHLRALVGAGGAVREAPDVAAWKAYADRGVPAVVVDAILGTGLRDAPVPPGAEAIAELNRWREAGADVLAVDVPSGLPSDGGPCPWPVVRAGRTITMAAWKRGLLLGPAADAAGTVTVADIGIPRALLEADARMVLIEAGDAAAAWPPRLPDAYKGTLGHVLVVGGSVGKGGAAVLAALGALRAGAGLVTVATAAPALPAVAAARPEFMTEPLEATPSGGVDLRALERVVALARERDAVVLGPGLGRDPRTVEFVRAFVGTCPAPLVVDADALYAVAGRQNSGTWGHARVVLTPHAGEMARLLTHATDDIQLDRPGAALALAGYEGRLAVLKGRRTLIGAPDGRIAVSPTGNPGLATGGTGDVLAGVLGATLARGHDPWLAAVAAVYAHGHAGDLAAARRGSEGLVAGDVIETLPDALRDLAARAGGPAA